MINTLQAVKLVAGTLVVVGVVLGLLNQLLAPSALILESSPNRPKWMPWAAWAVPSFSALIYLYIDAFAETGAMQTPDAMPGLLYGLAALAASIFYGLRACSIFGVSKDSKAWDWKVHQFWFNFVGSLIGWSLLWPIVFSAYSCMAEQCTFSPSIWSAAALVFGFIGVTGHLPVTVMGVISGAVRIFEKLLELAGR